MGVRTSVRDAFGHSMWESLDQKVREILLKYEADMVGSLVEHRALQEDARQKLKTAEGETDTLSRKHAAAMDILRSIGSALLSGRGDGDPIFDEFSDNVRKTPDVIPLLAKAVNAECMALRSMLNDGYLKVNEEKAMEEMALESENMSEDSRTEEDARFARGNPFEKERALVAFSIDTDEALIICSSGSHIERLIDESGTSIANDLGLLDTFNPNDEDEWGLWIWEGHLRIRKGRVDFSKGKWRSPEEEEFVMIANGHELWPSAVEDEDEEE